MMKLLDWASNLSRRGFLTRGATTIAAAAVVGKTLLVDSAAASAARPAGLSVDQSRAVLRFTRDLFPHDRLLDAAYEKALASLVAEAASNTSTKQLLADGIAQLNASTTASSGKIYIDADENARVAAIKQIEGSAFFARVYADTITPLYNQPDIWAKFGYQGPSSALGGYLHRGFNDLDWL
jgi:hypothetical protein